MNQSKISVRYAKAIFSFALEKNILDDVKSDITLIFDVCQQASDFIILIESPIVTTSKKQEIAQEIFKNKINASTLSFINLVFANKREIYLKNIARNFLNIYRKYKGIKQVIFTSAYQINDELRQNISESIKKNFNTEFELSEVVNEELIGGFVLRIDDQQYDTSISRKLNKLRRDLINISFENTIS